MCIFKPGYYILHLLLFNVIGLTHYTSHASHVLHVTETPRLVVKPARLLVQGSGDNEWVGRLLSLVPLPAPAFLLRQDTQPESHQQHHSSGNAHVQKVRSYLMGKDGRGAPEGMWGNRRGFTAMRVPNGNTQIPSCLGSRTLGLSQIPVFPFKPLSKFSPSLGDKNLNPACSHQLWEEFPAASYKCQAESLLNSVLDHYTKRTIRGVNGCLKIMSNKAQSNCSVSMF